MVGILFALNFYIFVFENLMKTKKTILTIFSVVFSIILLIGGIVLTVLATKNMDES